MFKSLSKILLLSGAAIVGSTYFMSIASAEPKIMFRYVTGGGGGISNGGNTGGGTTEPETPEEPEIERTSIFMRTGNISHFDSNSNGIIDAGDIITAYWQIENTGSVDATNITTALGGFVLSENGSDRIVDGMEFGLTCPTTLAAGATGNCSGSINIDNGTLPEFGRSNFSIAAFPGTFQFENGTVNFDGNLMTDYIPIGSNFEVVGYTYPYSNVSRMQAGETIEFDIALESVDEEFNDVAVEINLIDFNTSIIADCGDTSNNSTYFQCSAVYTLKGADTLKLTLRGQNSSNFTIDYETRLTRLNGEISDTLLNSGVVEP